MTRIKMCGMRRMEDIEAANRLGPEYIGFVFAPASRRYVSPTEAAALRRVLRPRIQTVGVFVNEDPETVVRMLEEGIIDSAQLHGHEDETYLARVRQLTNKPLIKAFRIQSAEDAVQAQASSAEAILLDAGAGDGKTFDWDWLAAVTRPYFLAGGLTPGNVSRAVAKLNPYAVDVSSGVETDGIKDVTKMRAFVCAVREGKEAE